MTASIVTFANLGKKTNLKTHEAESVIRTFFNHGDLQQVICQLSRGHYFPETIQAVPKTVYYPLRAVDKVFGSTILTRARMEDLVDTFAAHRIKHADVTIFMSTQFRRTIAAAKRSGSVTIGITDTVHSGYNEKLNTEESIKLGIPTWNFAGRGRDWSYLTTFDYLIATSDFAAQTYVDAGYSRDRIFAAHLDVDSTHVAPFEDRPQDHRVFRALYLGYTTPLKGIGYLIEAWQQLKLRDAELIIAGGLNGLPTELRARYETAILQDPSIKLVGEVGDPATLYRGASCFVFPSLTEAFSRTVLEAMASGLPVITTKHARGIVADTKSGFVVPIRDSKALAEKIRYLYDNRDVAAQMGKEARKTVGQKKPFGEAVYEVYKEILQKEGRL